MLRAIFLIPTVSILLHGCCTKKSEILSFWESKKKDFKYFNKTEFVSNFSDEEYQQLTQIKHPLFDSLIHMPVYLYSWQAKTKATIEFTVAVRDEFYGDPIYYVVLDKSGHFVSWEKIASSGGDGVNEWNVKSRSLCKDVLFKISSAKERQPDKNSTYMESTEFTWDSMYTHIMLSENGIVVDDFKRWRGMTSYPKRKNFKWLYLPTSAPAK